MDHFLTSATSQCEYRNGHDCRDLPVCVSLFVFLLSLLFALSLFLLTTGVL